MDLKLEYYQNLFERFLNDELSSSEIMELFEFISNNPDNLKLINNEEKGEIIFENLLRSAELSESVSIRMKDRLIEQIHAKQRDNLPSDSYLVKDKKLYIIKYWWAAACILIMGSIFFWVSNQYKHRTEIAAVTFKNEIKKTSTTENDAILTLSDGSQIVLDADSNGVIALQGSSQINIKNGYLIYNKIGEGNSLNDLTYNTIATPKGKNFKMILSDNTIVWLNAESSISYPTNFSHDERKIKITGEAYFEVAHDKSKPFIVQIDKDKEIKVLGTHFNVNSYDKESIIKTTLFEGSVQLKAGNKTRMLTPGEQAAVNIDNGIKIIKDVNLNQVIAWKNGTFSFLNEELPAVMKELSRWYDFEVKYAGKIPDAKFNGEIGRDLSLDQVLKILKHARVKYVVDEKTVTIFPDKE